MAASLSDLRTRVRLFCMDTDSDDYTWSTDEVGDAIADAIQTMWPDVYARKVKSIGTTSLATYEYAVGAGVERVGRVEVKDADGIYLEVMDWNEANSAIIFGSPPLSAGNDIRVTYRGKFSASSPNHPDYCDRAVVIEASAILFETFLSERARFQKYSAKLNKEAITGDELIAIIKHRHDRFNSLLDGFRMPPISSQRQRALGMTEGVQPAHSGRRRESEARTNV